jgi:catechol 2,3-dioxygenase-like lactoylglutathione lyase family enzyme
MTEQYRRTLRIARITLQIGIPTLVFAVLSIPLKAQTSSQTPPLAGVAHVAIRVHDLAAARAFYEKLGFQQAFDLRKNDIPYESFIKINDHQFIELYPVTEKDPEPAFLHLCFEGNDLQAIHGDYIGRGLTPTQVRKAGAGNLLFTMVGPERQNIEYTQYMPGSLHSNDEGKHLSDDRVANRLISVSLSMKDTAAARDFYINQLAFKPIAGDPMFLHMPGDSGQEVEIAQSTLGARARIILQTSNLNKAARHLHKEQIAVTKTKDTLEITDPDGNFILIDAH